MYIVRDQKTKAILYIDHDIKRSAKAKDVYPSFDAKTMESGWSQSDELPEYFKIEKNGQIIELSLQEQIDAGIVVLQTSQKIENNQICDKTLHELVEEGLIEISPFEKTVNDCIVPKNLEEQLRDGLIQLDPSEKIVDDQIVTKTLEEELTEGLIEIDEPFEYVIDNTIRQRPLEELVNNNLLKTVAQCEKALRLLSGIVEEAIAVKYPPGYEMKLVKDQMIWLETGKPKDDERNQKYLDMQAYVDSVKEQNKPLRDQIKSIMATLQKPDKPRKARGAGKTAGANKTTKPASSKRSKQ